MSIYVRLSFEADVNTSPMPACLPVIYLVAFPVRYSKTTKTGHGGTAKRDTVAERGEMKTSVRVCTVCQEHCTVLNCENLTC